MLRSVRICSLHDLPARNPASSSLSNASTSFCSLFNSTLQKTFPGTDSRVIPLQLLQSLRHPFFGNGTMTPCLHSFGTSSVCHIVLNNWVNSFITASPPYCSNSAGMNNIKPKVKPKIMCKCMKKCIKVSDGKFGDAVVF